LAITLCSAPLALSAAEPQANEGPQLPVALVWGPGNAISVALRESRRVVTVDPLSWKVTGGWNVPVSPASLAVADDGTTLLLGGIDGDVVAIDTAAQVVSRLKVGRGPIRVAPLAEGHAAVGARWDPLLRVIDWKKGRVVSEHPLGFAPGA